MLYLKEANKEDIDKEYECIKQIPRMENGYENLFYYMNRIEFELFGIKKMQALSQGKISVFGEIPTTYFFLWDDDNIVGLFKIRHQLKNHCALSAGQISYGILKQYRNRGYGTAGLGLALEKAKDLVKEDIVYMSAYKTNVASIKMMEANGAKFFQEDDEVVFYRIRIRGEENEEE